ncbi:flagellar basal-body MS-ring/collar protein FliF [Histidinibacterium lentulum]|nr:flagellar basal-body MS-ring/collar protein FliF [Histidinibacterium lentulum]
MQRKAIVVVAALAVFGAVLAIGRSGTSREMALLYAGLDPAAAGEVLAALDQAGAAYEVRSGAIMVEAATRDLLRMTLAGQGLPANGPQGYELLDSLNGFGTTSQMFDAAYWRAKEGELARTIQASADVRSARVHISTAATRGFQRAERSTASVTVDAVSPVHPDRARAFRFLVASAVPGLSPEDVAVIDGEGNLVGQTGETGAPGSPSDREAEMRARVERLLAARVGPGNAVVELSIETGTDREQIVERRFDPEGRVAISTEIEERSGTSSDNRGAVTVASNLPDGDAGQDGETTSQTSETRELTNFEVSETQREITRGPGAIRRITVAVMVNAVAASGTDPATPRSEEELADLRDLVASAVGYDEARGDVITLRSMAFEPLPETGSEAGPAAVAGMDLDVMGLVQLGILALVALILGLFVIRPILSSRAAPRPVAPPALTMDLPDPGSERRVAALPAAIPSAVAATLQQDSPDPVRTGAADDPVDRPVPQEPVARLRQLIEEREDEALRILQNWVDEPRREDVA